MGMRLLYEHPPEPSFDPLSCTPWLIELLKRFVLVVLVAFLFFVPFFILDTILYAIVRAIFGAAAGVLLALFAYGVFVLAVGAMFWLPKLPALLSEWKYSLDDKGPAAATAFEHITWAFRERRTPVASIKVREMTIPGQGARRFLEVKDGLFVGYISSFAYGGDLFIGWKFYLNLSPARFVLISLARMWHTVTGRGSQIYVTLRYDAAKAMREAMHAAAREGVDVAAGQVPPRGEGIVGREVPIEAIADSTPSLSLLRRAELLPSG